MSVCIHALRCHVAVAKLKSNQANKRSSPPLLHHFRFISLSLSIAPFYPYSHYHHRYLQFHISCMCATVCRSRWYTTRALSGTIGGGGSTMAKNVSSPSSATKAKPAEVSSSTPPRQPAILVWNAAFEVLIRRTF